MAFAVVATGGVALGFGSFAVIAGSAVTVSQLALASTLAAGALNSLSAASAAKKAAKALNSTGTQLDLQTAKNAPVPFILGRTAVAGYIIDQWVDGAKNSDAHLKIALSGAPIKGIQKYLAGDYEVSWSGDPNTGMVPVASTAPASELYKGKLYQAWFNGSATDNQQLTGIAHVHLKAVYDTKVFPQGIPENKWVAEGLLLYDPRKDSTFPGGSGSHRWEDPRTHEYTQNPYIHALNYALGYFVLDSNGARVRVGGIGAPVEDVEFPPFLAGANLADELGWKIGGLIDSSVDKKSALDAILIAGSGEAIIHGASISCIYNAFKTVLDTITHDDVADSVEITNTSSWRDRINTIAHKFRSETNGWEYVTGNRVSIPAYVDDDGGEIRTKEIEYSLVQDASQSAQLAAYDLVNGREFLQFSVVCKPRLLGVRIGDCVNVVLPGYGINGQKCLVLASEFDPNTYRVKLLLRSETDSKHDWALGRTDVAPPSPALGGYDPANPEAPGLTAWVATGTTITGTDGVSTPAIIVTGAADDVNASSIIIEYRKTGDVAWNKYVEVPANTTRVEITGLAAATAYDVAISYRTVLDVVADNKRILTGIVTGANVIPWTSNAITGRPDWMFKTIWAPFQDTYVPQIVLDYGNTVTQVANDLAAVQANTGVLALEGYAKRDELRDVANATNELAYAAIRNVLADAQEEVETKRLTFLDGEEIGTVVRNEQTRTDDTVSTLNLIGVKTANGTAFVLDTSKVQVGNGVSMASKFTGLQSETANALAQATQQFNTVTTAQQATANAVTALGVTVNNNNAAVTQQFATTANAIASETTARLTLASTVANNASYANQQFATLTTADSAEANARVALASTVANNAAVATQQFNTVANAVAANASILTALQSTVANNNSTATQQLSTLTNQQAATSSFLSKLGAEFNGNTAILLDRNKVYVDSSTSMASRDALIESRFSGGSSSYLLSTATSASTSASAAVNTLQQMGATLNNGSAFALDSTKVTVSGYGSLAQTVTSLQSQINDRVTGSQLSASVSSQVTAQTGPGSSIASQITSVSTTANSASSTASLALSSSNGNGAQAVLAVTNTANGNKLTGIRINGSTTSTIDLMASSLRVVDASGANPTVPFAVIGGTTYMDNVVARNIGAGTITADKIVGGAVTNLVVNEYVGQAYFSTSEMEHLSFSYFCEGGKISLDVYCEIGTNTSSPAGAVYRLYCDSSVYNAGAVYCTPSWGQLGSTTPVVVNPGYGSHTFRVTYQATPGSGSVRANRTYVRLTELKK